jgi:hypothetical protein
VSLPHKFPKSAIEAGVDLISWKCEACGEWVSEYEERRPCTKDWRNCGGCAGLGAHRRWCVESVGPAAAMLGKYAEEAESLGDRVGPNEMGASSHLWTAAALLRVAAEKACDQWRNGHGT